MFGQRPAFGASSTFGGFGTSTASTGFGSSFGRPVFGAPQTTAASTPFGTSTSTGTSLFGQSQPATGGTGGLFGATTQSSSFGSTGFGTTPTTGGGLFGTTTQPSNTGLFGSNTAASFGGQKPFSFGTPTTSAGTSLFGTSTGAPAGSLFGSTLGQQQSGTTIKYNAITGTDTMNRGGTSTSIQTKIEVITAMKEYEGKSLEELRAEDYGAGRKGQAAGSGGFGFGQNKFMTSQPQNMFGSQQATTSLFGQKPAENKGLFGANPSFGTATSGGGLFGSATPAFGKPQSDGFSFGGSANQPKPGSFSFTPTTSAQPLFGAQSTTTATTFGSTGFGFGNQVGTTQAGFGQNKPAFGGTNFGGTTVAGGTASTGIFGPKPATGFGTPFGQTSTATPFGTTNTSTGLNLFNNQNQNKTAGFSFGATNTGGFGTSTSGFGTGSIFGQPSNQPKPGGLSFGTSGGFGTNTSTGFGFGNTNPGTGLFGGAGGTSGGLFGGTSTGLNAGTNTFGSFGSGGLGVNPLQANPLNVNSNSIPLVNNNNINNLIKALAHNPFGNSSLLKSSTVPTGKADELLNSGSGTTSSDADSSKPSMAKKPTYVLPCGSSKSAKPHPIGINKNLNGGNGMDSGHQSLFAGLEDTNDLSTDDPFRPKSLPSVKKLNLRVFKNVKPESQTQQSGIETSPVNGSLVSAAPTPLTTPLSSLGISETPNPSSLPPSHENSPTPDIIKGRDNIKRLNIPKKNALNDTLADFATSKGSSQSHTSDVPKHSDFTESNKDNANISLFEASSIDNIPEADNTSLFEPHPTGIKLTRRGYYTLPSLSELSEMIDGDGKCLVENFTVGRTGYGNACFPGITDVAGLDLDSIVFIVRKELEIYPEGTDKPPKGEGLNRPAYVTLDCVWPVDKTTRDIVKSEERLAAMGWSDYLEKQCLKMDATFVEYRPETGSWLFKVRHFSKYGLQEEEEEATVPVEQNKRPTEKAPIEAGKSILAAQLHKASAFDTDAQLRRSPFTHSMVGEDSPQASPLVFPSKRSAPTMHGPPAIGLTSPLSNFSQHASEAELPMLGKKIYLDCFTAEGQDEFFDTVPNESGKADEHLNSGPGTTLSDTDSSKRSLAKKPTYVLPCGINDSLTGGNGMDFGHQSLFAGLEDTNELSTDDPFRSKSLPSVKKLNFRVSKNVKPESQTQVYLDNFISESQEELEAVPNEPRNDVSSVLREPRTTYELIPSSRDIDAECETSSPLHLEEHIPLKTSLLSSTKNSILDGSAFMSKSFRIGWGPGWTLVNTGTNLGLSDEPTSSSQNQQQEPSPAPFLFLGASSSVKPLAIKSTPRYKISIEKVHLSNVDKEKHIDPLLESCLQNVLDMSRTNPDNNDLAMETDTPILATPKLDLKRGIELLHRLAQTASQVEEAEGRDDTLSSIFNLCVSLWGKLDFYNPAIDGKSAYVESQYRKEALSQWLESVSEFEVTDEVRKAKSDGDEDSYLSAVFSYMSARQISEACCLAQDNGSHHLALLLAQTCLGSEVPRQLMQKQLNYWAEYGIDAFIPLPQLVLYALVAGLPTHQTQTCFVNTCSGIDWRRALAIHLWYICPATASISEALVEYERASGLISSENEPYCETPRPPYTKERPSMVQCKVNHDICFHLLKLYVDSTHSLDVLLESSSVTPDPLDLTASWLIWCVLKSLNYTLMSESKVSSLHLNMASLLEAEGHWHWSAFVLLFITEENRAKKEINDLLDRHLLVDGEDGESDPFYREKEHFLLNDLCLPHEWLYRAKSVRAKGLKLIDEEAWYCMKCDNFERAHILIVESIAPNAIINEDHKYLRQYLKEFQREHALSKVPDWENGGGIFLDYLCLIEQVEEMKKSAQLTGSKVESLRPRLLGLCSKLNNLKCFTAVQRLSVSEMSRVAVSVLRAILGDNPEATRVLAEQVSSLPLTHECALEELNLITHQYLTHVTLET